MTELHDQTAHELDKLIRSIVRELGIQPQHWGWSGEDTLRALLTLAQVAQSVVPCDEQTPTVSSPDLRDSLSERPNKWLDIATCPEGLSREEWELTRSIRRLSQPGDTLPNELTFRHRLGRVTCRLSVEPE